MTQIIKKNEARELQTKDYRGCLIKAVDKNKISIDACSLKSLLSHMKILTNKIGASKTIIISGKLNYDSSKLSKELENRLNETNNDVILKISYPNMEDNGLFIEAEIYNKIINKLFFLNYTPHVVLSYGAYSCTSKKLESNLNKNDQNFFNKFKLNLSKKFDTRFINILILEKVDAILLKEWFLEPNLTYEDYLSVLFQLIYTLAVFNLFGLKHNDLHYQNIFIEKVKETKYIYIVSENTYFEVPIKYLVKIYDFDYSNIVKIKSINPSDLIPLESINKEIENIQRINTHLDINNFCMDYGVCNDPNPKFDLFVVLGFFFTHTSSKFSNLLNKLIFKISSIKLLTTKWGHFYRLCKLVGRKCKGNYIPSDNELKTPVEALFEFNEFKKDMKNYPEKYDPKTYPYVYHLLPFKFL